MGHESFRPPTILQSRRRLRWLNRASRTAPPCAARPGRSFAAVEGNAARSVRRPAVPRPRVPPPAETPTSSAWLSWRDRPPRPPGDLEPMLAEQVPAMRPLSTPSAARSTTPAGHQMPAGRMAAEPVAGPADARPARSAGRPSTWHRGARAVTAETSRPHGSGTPPRRPGCGPSGRTPAFRPGRTEHRGRGRAYRAGPSRADGGGSAQRRWPISRERAGPGGGTRYCGPSRNGGDRPRRPGPDAGTKESERARGDLTELTKTLAEQALEPTLGRRAPGGAREAAAAAAGPFGA